MKVIYDCESDTLSIILRPGKVADSDETREGLIMDNDKTGKLISIELLDASEEAIAPMPSNLPWRVRTNNGPSAFTRSSSLLYHPLILRRKFHLGA